MKRMLFSLLAIAVLIVSGAQAQTSDALLARLIQEDKASIDALVLYPENVRHDILQASQYPELVVRISELQKVTSQQFSDLLSPYQQADQERFWELARYPQLVEVLAARGGVKDEALMDYPEIVRTDARWADQGHRDILVKMNDIYVSSQSAFESLLSGYPAPAQKAFRSLVALPEVFNILSDDLKMTVLVGDLYRRDPVWVDHKLDSLNLEVARKNAEDLQAWRDSLAANPQALQEFQASSEEFRKASGAPVADEQQVQQVNQYTSNNYYYNNGNNYPNYYNQPNVYYGGYNYYNPYPWWYGYPAWYDYPYWYPQPYWYHSGYYYGAGGVIVVYGMPSPYYTWWYFNQPWHHSHYPYLTHHMLCYHEGHRDSPSGFGREVANWEHRNQNAFGKDWLKNDAGRPGRIQEFGQFEVAYHNAVVTQPHKAPTEEAYFQMHSKDYPLLSESVNNSPRGAEGKPNVVRPTETWPTRPVNDAKPTTQPVVRPKNNVDTKPVNDAKPTTQPVVRPKNNVDTKPVNDVKSNPQPVYQTKPNSDTRPANEVKPNPQPVYQPQPNTDSKPKTQPQMDTRPQQPKIERPPQNQNSDYNRAPTYHQDTWQRVEPRPTVSPKPTMTPRPTITPKQNISPKGNR